MKKQYKFIVLIIFLVLCASAILIRFATMESGNSEESTQESLEETVIDPALIQGPEELVRLEKEPDMIPVDFLSLKERNEDVYAWIDIPDTNVHYPILQGGPDDSYYLNHTIDKEAGYPGSIYTESVNAKDFSDYNTVIYGHNMNNGTMFKHLHKFEDEEFFESHEFITIYTETEMKVYRVYAAVIYGNNHIMKSYDFDKVEDRIAYIESLDTGESKNHFRKGMELDEESKLITLATCIGGRPNNRYLVIGEEVESR